jgi:hypothetical protein
MIVLFLSVLIVLPLNAGLVGAIEPEQETSGSGENYTWNQRFPQNAPSQRTAPLMAYDQKEGKTLLFGGFVGGSQVRLNDTWIWDGNNWSTVDTIHLPAPRSGGGMAYDQATQRIVMFGGDGVSASLGDTWLWNWDTMDWEQQDPVLSPTPRGVPFMSYDYNNSNVVLFGGGPLNDTWVWDGANHTWDKKNPEHSPSARAFGQMSYDPVNQNVVLFGGNGGSQILSDTWTWDGTDWTQHATANTPPARFGYGLSYDGAHIILFGGDGVGNVQLRDTWFWDGSNWTQQNIVTNNRGHIGMVYDERNDQVVSFGGYGGSSGNPIINETWTLQSSPIVTTRSVESVGSTYAELNSELVMAGKKPVLEQGIEVKNLTNNETVKYASQNIGIGTFTIKASNLIPNTSYTYRAYATDFYGVTFAPNEGDFNTLEHPPIYVDSTNYSLRVGGTHQTVVEALNEEDNSRYVVTEDLTFSSADSEIASVDENGLVTAHSEGETVITVLYKTVPVQISVKVSYVAPVLINIASASNKYTLEKGKTQQTVIKAVYDDGTYLPLTDDLVFTSLDESIATVDHKGLITAKAAGTVQIQVSYSDITIVIEVTVKDNANSGGGNGEGPGGSSGGNGGNGSGGSGGGTGSNQGTNKGTPQPANKDDNLKDPVSGEPIGTVVKQEKDGKKETTIKLDAYKAKDTLNKSNRKSLDIDSNEDVDQTVTEIPGPLAKWLDEKEGSVELKTKLGRYILPVKQLGVDQFTTGNNEEQILRELQYKVMVSKASDSVMQNVKSIASKDGYSVIGSAVNFGVSSSMNGVDKKVPNFDQYAVRLIALPEGYDPNKITTGIIYDQSQQSFMHVPTQVVKLDGQYFAKINSLVSEGTFALIWNEETFADTANHWGKHIIDEMASRLVIEGVTEKTFDPNREITRAEFAAIAVRAFGLQDETAKGQGFEDVPSDAWYSEYINTASAYGLLKGYNDGSFKPSHYISRQEATAILARAIKLAKIDASVTDINTLNAYKDANQVSAWAQINVSYLVEKGIMAGDTTGKLHARNPVTRAETAALMQRILKFAELI